MRKLIIPIVLLLALIPNAAFASDVTDAKYLSTITVSSNSTTSLTDQAAVFNLSTADMISNLMLAGTADDCAMLTGSGASDLQFMPGYSTNPWCTWVNSIGASASISEYLYSDDVTGGKIRYFPDTAGMTTDDDDSLEILSSTDNQTLEQSGYLDSTAGGSKYLLQKTNLWNIYTGADGAGTITAIFTDNSSSGVPNPQVAAASDDCGTEGTVGAEGFSLAQGINVGYYNATYRYYDNATRFAMAIPKGATIDSSYITLTAATDRSTTTVNALLKAEKAISPTTFTNAADFNARTRTTASAAWANIATWTTNTAYNSPSLNAVLQEVVNVGSTTYIVIFLTDNGSTAGDGNNRLAYSYNASTSKAPKLYVQWHKDAINVAAHATAITPAAGDHSWKVTVDSSYLKLYVDNVLKDTEAMGNAVYKNNSNDWVEFYGGGMKYVEYSKKWINNTLKQNIDWEYAAIFQDSTIYDNDATPTFRTTSSDSHLTASVTAQKGLTTASPPSSSTAGGWTMIGTTPAAPTGLFREGGDTYGIAGFDIGQKVTDTANAAGQDPTSWHFVFAFGLACAALLGLYAVTQKAKLGIRGSLTIAVMGAEAVLIYFYYMQTIPGMALIPFGLIGILLILWHKSPAPID